MRRRGAALQGWQERQGGVPRGVDAENDDGADPVRLSDIGTEMTFWHYTLNTTFSVFFGPYNQ
jgi:hypothetical protein